MYFFSQKHYTRHVQIFYTKSYKNENIMKKVFFVSNRNSLERITSILIFFYFHVFLTFDIIQCAISKTIPVEKFPFIMFTYSPWRRGFSSVAAVANGTSGSSIIREKIVSGKKHNWIKALQFSTQLEIVLLRLFSTLVGVNTPSIASKILP